MKVVAAAAVAVPPIVCAPEPLKFTVLPFGVKAPPVLTVQLPLTSIVVPFVPASVAPLSIVTSTYEVALVNVPETM